MNKHEKQFHSLMTFQNRMLNMTSAQYNMIIMIMVTVILESINCDIIDSKVMPKYKLVNCTFL